MGILGVFFLGACIYFLTMQQSYIFEPSTGLQSTPERVGLRADEVHIKSGSGNQEGELFSWWIPVDGKDAPTMLYLHGNDKNIGYSRELEYARSMHKLGLNVLMIDYRGYGKSTGGPPSESKVYEDAESAWNYLARQKGVAPDRIFIYGHSLGGAIAIDLAIHHPDAAGLIEESSFTTMKAMSDLDYGFMPTSVLVHEQFDSLSKVPHLKIPFLIIHGTWDKTIPFQMAEQLYAAAPEPKTIKLIQGGDHEDSCLVGRVECQQLFATFIARNLH